MEQRKSGLAALKKKKEKLLKHVRECIYLNGLHGVSIRKINTISVNESDPHSKIVNNYINISANTDVQHKTYALDKDIHIKKEK